MANESTKKKSFFNLPMFKSAVKSANVKIFPEAAIGYFLAPTLALFANSILSSYLNKYFNDVLGLTTWASLFVTLLPIISVIFVIAGNILVGKLMDHNRSLAGKARPLVLISIPLSILALLVLFVFVPFPDLPLIIVPGNEGEILSKNIATIILVAIGYNLWFAIAYPFYFTPHSALVNLSTRNSGARGLLATCTNATVLAAIGLSSMILPFFIGFLFVQRADGTLDAEASYNAWKIFAIALMILTAVGAIAEFYFTRERVTEESFALATEEDGEKKTVTTKKQMKICFKDKYWWIIIGFFFLYQLGGMLKNCSVLYFCQAWLPGYLQADGSLAYFTDSGIAAVYNSTTGGFYSGLINTVGAAPTAIGMVLAPLLANKLGKGKSILFGAILAGIGGALGFLIIPVSGTTARFAIILAAFIIKALGSTPAMYLSLALMGDVLDHQEALHGVRTDGFTMTIYGAIMAGMTGIATGIINLLLGASGYDPKVATVQEGFQTGMLWAFIGGETICYILIAIIFFAMNVEKFSSLDHKAIVIDQKAIAEAAGKEYVPTEVRLAQEEAQANKEAIEAGRLEVQKRAEKKGENVEAALEAYDKQQEEKAAAAAAKKAEADAKAAPRKAELKAIQDEKDKALLPEYLGLRQATWGIRSEYVPTDNPIAE